MPTAQLDNLKKKREQINARIQKMEASQKTKARKQETRRKILVGAFYLDKTRKEGVYDALVKSMDGYLKRDSDRVLFDLKSMDADKVGVEPELAEAV